jgi:hypothetical protein
MSLVEADRSALRDVRTAAWRGVRGRRTPFAPIAILLAAACAPISPGPTPLPSRARIWDPALACDDRGHVYATALTQDSTGAPRFLWARSESSGDQWTTVDPAPFGRARGARRRPHIATSDGGAVYTLWEDTRAGPVTLWFSRSLDAGATWLADDVCVSGEAAGPTHIAAPAIACDRDRAVYVVWRDNREGFDALYCNASRDAGATWLQRDVRITGIDLGAKDEPRWVCDNDGDVYAAWIELDSSGRTVHFNASTDGGETWLLQDTILDDEHGAFAVEIGALDRGVVVAAWTSLGPWGQQVFTARSTNRGAFWERAQALGPLRSRDVLADASAPALAHDGRDHVYVGWHATGFDGTSRIVVAASADAGASFESTVLAIPGQLDPRRRTDDPRYSDVHRGLRAPFRLAADPTGNVYLAWIEPDAGWRITVDRLTDFGRTWSRLSSQPELQFDAPADESPPLLACDDLGHVHLSWDAVSTLHVATSAFYGAPPWRQRSF